MAKIYIQYHKLWCQWKYSPSSPKYVVLKVNFNKGCLIKFTFETTFCDVESELLPLTPQFVVLKVNFCHRHNKFVVSPIFQLGLKLWGFGKQKVIWKTFGISQLICEIWHQLLFQKSANLIFYFVFSNHVVPLCLSSLLFESCCVFRRKLCPVLPLSFLLNMCC